MLDTDYTVTGAEVTAGGTVTLLTGATVGDSIQIVRDVPVEQTTHIPPSGPLDVPAINIQISKLIAIDQQNVDAIDRTVRLSDSVFLPGGLVGTTPVASEYLKWNTTAQGLRTFGYATVGDGGQAEYFRVASQPSTVARFRSADRYLPNGSIDAGNGGWWEMVISGLEDVPKFGVVAGVGSTTAVNNAVSAASIYFPPASSNYVLSGDIAIPANRHIWVQRGATIQNTGGQFTAYLPGSGNVHFQIEFSPTDVPIQVVQIEGNIAYSPGTYGFHLAKIDGFQLKNNIIYNHARLAAGYAINAASTATSGHIDGNVIRSPGAFSSGGVLNSVVPEILSEPMQCSSGASWARLVQAIFFVSSRRGTDAFRAEFGSGSIRKFHTKVFG